MCYNLRGIRGIPKTRRMSKSSRLSSGERAGMQIISLSIEITSGCLLFRAVMKSRTLLDRENKYSNGVPAAYRNNAAGNLNGSVPRESRILMPLSRQVSNRRRCVSVTRWKRVTRALPAARYTSGRRSKKIQVILIRGPGFAGYCV